MIHGDLASSILYTLAGALFIAAVLFAVIGEWARRDRRGAFTDAEQLRTAPWPPPPPPIPQVVHAGQATYDKPLLALPRGEG